MHRLADVGCRLGPHFAETTSSDTLHGFCPDPLPDAGHMGIMSDSHMPSQSWLRYVLDEKSSKGRGLKDSTLDL